MDAQCDEKVRTRAYALWELEGQPEGGALRHWVQAAEELRAEEQDRIEVSGDVQASTTTEAADTAVETHEAGDAGS